MKRSRVLAGFAAVAAAVLGFVSVPSAASADVLSTHPVVSGTSSVAYNCVEDPYPGGQTSFDVTFSAPSKVRVGVKFTLKATVAASVTIPIDVPANGVSGSVQAVLGGAGSGVVSAAGLTNATVVPAGQLLTLTGGAATVFPASRGVLTFTPGVLETTNWLGQHLVCTPYLPPATALSIVVK
ncbi:hypothetical protein [Verrucosispora sp. TAA-831]|uniref:hypothetical protein n=1 Tax=Verrucosispora sp. TAA-831 TaxID=3422227 RepID=UPI003D6FDBA2